jgi:hypothetical protein
MTEPNGAGVITASRPLVYTEVLPQGVTRDTLVNRENVPELLGRLLGQDFSTSDAEPEAEQ